MDRSGSSLIEHLEHESETFRRRFMLVIAGTLLVATLVVAGVYALSGGDVVTFATIGTILVLEAVATGMSWVWRHRLGAQILFYGAVLAIFAASVLPEVGPDGRNTMVNDSFFVFLVAIVCVGFVAGRRSAAALTALCALLTVFGLLNGQGEFRDPEAAIGTSVTLVMIMITIAVAMWFFTARQEAVLDALRVRMEETASVMVAARQISQGDLTVEVEGEGDAADVTREMLVGLRDLVRHIQQMASQVNAATSELLAMAGEQQKGANRQSAAIVEAQATLGSLVEASRKITESAGAVRANSEQALG
ncbi:MAG: methyl-accepting chemotaxis protein, partial [Deltaproteobacteria bacterium]|nr:methyl-accepting chemotaxis protein [Deltaproteobacteria bacterium]